MWRIVIVVSCEAKLELELAGKREMNGGGGNKAPLKSLRRFLPLVAGQRALQAGFVYGKTASKRFVFLDFRTCSIAMSSTVQLDVGRA
jgi:hypothetical protein